MGVNVISVYLHAGLHYGEPSWGAGRGDGILCVWTRWAKMGLERGRILCAHQQPRFQQTGFPPKERSSEALRSWEGYEDFEEEEPGGRGLRGPQGKLLSPLSKRICFGGTAAGPPVGVLCNTYNKCLRTLNLRGEKWNSKKFLAPHFLVKGV